MIASLPKMRNGRHKSGSTSTSGAVQSLNRGLMLLERIAESGRNGAILTDIALQVGLPASTTHRLLNTLEQAGFVRRDPELGIWQVGLTAFSIGNAFLSSRDVVAQARPYMKKLMEDAGETVNLAVENKGEVVYIAQIECIEMMRMIVKLGGRAPVHASAVGKAMMAWMNEEQIEQALRHRGLQRLTPQTITTMSALKEDMKLIRQRGFSYDLEEHTVGLHCVSSPIFNEHGEPIAGLSLSGPKARVTFERLPELGVMVNMMAVEITKSIGGTHPGTSGRK